MLPDRILHTLRCRPVLRRAISLAGYVGGAALMTYGGIAFSTTADMEAQMSAGWPLVGGILLMGATHELRAAIRAATRTPDPSNS